MEGCDKMRTVVGGSTREQMSVREKTDDGWRREDRLGGGVATGLRQS